MTPRVAVAAWTLTLLIAAAMAVLVVTSEHEGTPVASAVLASAVGVAFVGAGLTARTRRPGNRIGILMILAGFSWFAGLLSTSDQPLLFTIGVTLAYVAWGFVAYLMLAFPSGTLQGWASRVVVVTAFVIVLPARLPWVLFNDLREDFPDGPRNAFLIEHRENLATAIETVVQVAALVIIAATIALLVRRWRAATPPLRRALAPVFLTSGVTVVVLATWVAFDVTDAPGEDAVYSLVLAALLTVPLSFLLGLLRSRLARAGVSRLLVELGDAGPRDLRGSIARALGDPSLEIAYWIPGSETFVDLEGNVVALPEPGVRATTVVERNGERVAALVHDASLLDDPDLLQGVAAAAGLALESERRLAALAESEARSRALFDAIPDLIFRMSGAGTYLDVKGNEADLVAPADELIGADIFDVLPRDVAERIMRCTEAVLERGVGVEAVEYQLRIGPMNRTFEGRVVPSGKDEVLLIVRDISERKRNEAQLARLQDELRARFDELERERDFIRAVVQAAPSFFCLVDPAGRIVRLNRTLERASGRMDDESTRGRRFWETFIAPDEADEVRRELEEAFASRSSREHESDWVTRDGERLRVAWSATPLLDETGEQRFLISGMDITERKRQEEELRRSRARIVEAGDVERRRLERNLHDGAQQRLVAISISLRLVQSKLRTDPDGAERILALAGDELAQALEELRELARGIHPAILTDRGLEPALEALLARAPVPVRLAEAPTERLPEPVEAAAYYVVSEALANMTKYAAASSGTVRVSRDDGRAIVEVADDGIGGADASRGSGLRGLADRVEALDGQLNVSSPPGRGTTIRAEIPYN
ncbi:MAG: PAS domain-containing protein [Actinomycetota bacterium]|nr:PAS domain-containing protein [Actinomycetota bacterium]